MLTLKPDSNVVECDKGFSVEINSRGTIIYIERFRKITVGTDKDLNAYYTIVFKENFNRWDPPFGIFPIRRSKREQIIARVENVAKLRRYNFKFE